MSTPTTILEFVTQERTEATANLGAAQTGAA